MRRRAHAAYDGLLGLIPRFGDIRLDGDIVLLLFLPPILYWESLNTSFREIRANLRIIVFVLREVQSAMDLEEARLLGPVDTG